MSIDMSQVGVALFAFLKYILSFYENTYVTNGIVSFLKFLVQTVYG